MFYSFNQHIFTFDGQSQRFYVLFRAPHNPQEACVEIHVIDPEHALKLSYGVAANGIIGLNVEAIAPSSIQFDELNTSVMALVMQDISGDAVYLAQAALRVDLLRTELGPEGEFKLVIDGLGITYLEGTDPINFKLYQFDPSQVIYLSFHESAPYAGPTYNLEGLQMTHLAISWTSRVK